MCVGSHDVKQQVCNDTSPKLKIIDRWVVRLCNMCIECEITRMPLVCTALPGRSTRARQHCKLQKKTSCFLYSNDTACLILSVLMWMPQCCWVCCCITFQAAGCALAAVAKAHKYTKLGVTFVTAATAPSSGISEDAVKSVIIGILSDEFEGIRFRGKQSRAKSSSWHVTSIELLHTGWSDWPSPRFLPDTVAVAQGVLLSR